MSRQYKEYLRLHSKYYDGSPGQAFISSYENFDKWCLSHVDSDLWFINRKNHKKGWTSDNVMVVRMSEKSLCKKGDVLKKEEIKLSRNKIVQLLQQNKRVRVTSSQWHKNRDKVNDECERLNIQFRTIKIDDYVIIER